MQVRSLCKTRTFIRTNAYLMLSARHHKVSQVAPFVPTSARYDATDASDTGADADATAAYWCLADDAQLGPLPGRDIVIQCLSLYIQHTDYRI